MRLCSCCFGARRVGTGCFHVLYPAGDQHGGNLAEMVNAVLPYIKEETFHCALVGRAGVVVLDMGEEEFFGTS